ncbi:MAG: type II secretion system protein [Luteolibacter sp.]
MKLTHTAPMRRNSGMTLLELTIVILVLLSLVFILFIGARAWKKGSDRATNIMNIRNVQQAVRGHTNVNGFAVGDALPFTDIVGSGKYIRSMTPPNLDIGYIFGTRIPPIGTLYLTATYATGADADYAPTAGSYADW